MKITKEEIYEGFQKYKSAEQSHGLKLDRENQVFVDKNGQTYSVDEAAELLIDSGLISNNKVFGIKTDEDQSQDLAQLFLHSLLESGNLAGRTDVFYGGAKEIEVKSGFVKNDLATNGDHDLADEDKGTDLENQNALPDAKYDVATKGSTFLFDGAYWTEMYGEDAAKQAKHDFSIMFPKAASIEVSEGEYTDVNISYAQKINDENVEKLIIEPYIKGVLKVGRSYWDGETIQEKFAIVFNSIKQNPQNYLAFMPKTVMKKILFNDYSDDQAPKDVSQSDSREIAAVDNNTALSSVLSDPHTAYEIFRIGEIESDTSIFEWALNEQLDYEITPKRQPAYPFKDSFTPDEFAEYVRGMRPDQRAITQDNGQAREADWERKQNERKRAEAEFVKENDLGEDEKNPYTSDFDSEPVREEPKSVGQRVSGFFRGLFSRR